MSCLPHRFRLVGMTLQKGGETANQIKSNAAQTGRRHRETAAVDSREGGRANGALKPDFFPATTINLKCSSRDLLPHL